MRTTILVLVSFGAIAFARAQSDSSIASAQQALKDQGFYYGEITGKKDADTVAALRRYQIRNGLQVTGELNAETQKSLGVKGPVAPPPPRATPPPKVKNTPPPDDSNLRDDAPVTLQHAPREEVPRTQPPQGYAPGPRGLTPETSGIFDGTPYEVAPPDLQRRVIIGAQTLLARRGYYRSAIDGSFGRDTDFALRAFQSRFGLQASGRLDMETLAALGLLPGQRAPGVTAPRERVYRRTPRMTVTPDGEPIYEPR